MLLKWNENIGEPTTDGHIKHQLNFKWVNRFGKQTKDEGYGEGTLVITLGNDVRSEAGLFMTPDEAKQLYEWLGKEVIFDKVHVRPLKEVKKESR